MAMGPYEMAGLICWTMRPFVLELCVELHLILFDVRYLWWIMRVGQALPNLNYCKSRESRRLLR